MSQISSAGANVSFFTKVQLTISCSNLKNKDVTSKSDPLCAVLMEDFKTKCWLEVRLGFS